MEKWSALAMLDIIGSSGFGYGFRARAVGADASISGGGEAGEKYRLELDSYNTILDIGVHRTEWKIRHRVATGADSPQPGSLAC